MSIRAGRVIANVLYNYAGIVIGTAVGFLLTPVLIRHLGHVGFGAYVLLGSMVGYAALLDFGIGITVMRLVAGHVDDDDPSALRMLVSNGVALYACLGLIVLLGTFVIYPFLGSIFHLRGDELRVFQQAFLITGVSLAVTFPSAVYSGIMQGLHNFRAASILGLAQTSVGALIVFALLELGGGLVSITLGSALVSALAFLVKIIYVRRRHKLGLNRIFVRRPEILKLIRISSWLIVGNLAVTIIFDIDTLVVGVILGAAAVAAFGVTLGASKAMQSLGDALNSVTLSTSSTLNAQKDERGLSRLLLESIRITVVVLGPFVALSGVWGGQLLKLWVGPSFESSSSTLFVMALGTAIALVQGASAQLAIALGRQRTLLFVTVPEAIANLSLSVILARHLGILGVALGTAIPTAITTFAIVLPFTCRLTSTSLLKVYRRLVLPTAIPATVFIILKLNYSQYKFTGLAALGFASIVVVLMCYLLNFLLEPAERKTYLSLIGIRSIRRTEKDV